MISPETQFAVVLLRAALTINKANYQKKITEKCQCHVKIVKLFIFLKIIYRVPSITLHIILLAFLLNMSLIHVNPTFGLWNGIKVNKLILFLSAVI